MALCLPQQLSHIAYLWLYKISRQKMAIPGQSWRSRWLQWLGFWDHQLESMQELIHSESSRRDPGEAWPTAVDTSLKLAQVAMERGWLDQVANSEGEQQPLLILPKCQGQETRQPPMMPTSPADLVWRRSGGVFPHEICLAPLDPLGFLKELENEQISSYMSDTHWQVFISSDYTYCWRTFVAHQMNDEDYWPWHFLNDIGLHSQELHSILM